MIVLIVVGAVILLAFIGGVLAVRRRDQLQGGRWEEHIALADRQLEEARAADRGWDRTALEGAASRALAEQRPDFRFDDLHLVLVDDRPGVEEDRAHLVAMGTDGEARVVLARHESGWAAERVE